MLIQLLDEFHSGAGGKLRGASDQDILLETLMAGLPISVFSHFFFTIYLGFPLEQRRDFGLWFHPGSFKETLHSKRTETHFFESSDMSYKKWKMQGCPYNDMGRISTGK